MHKEINKVFILNRLYDIRKLLKNNVEKNVRCLWHKDRVPSAHIYNNAVWCFRCKRFFYVINYVKKLKLNIDDLIEELKQEYNKDIDGLIEMASKEVKFEKNVVYKVARKNNESFIDFCKNYFNNINKGV